MPSDLNLLLVLLMFASFMALLLSGYPVAFVLAGVGVAFALLGELLIASGFDVDADLFTVGLLVERLYGVMSSYNLVPLPLFVFMGHMLDRSGVAIALLTRTRFRRMKRLPKLVQRIRKSAFCGWTERMGGRWPLFTTSLAIRSKEFLAVGTRRILPALLPR